LDVKGRQTWHYLENDKDAEQWPQSTADKWFLGLPTVYTQVLLIARNANKKSIFRICPKRKPLSTL
jgi:hypothetical protein